MNITLTNEEANALANLLDIAVKAGGIRNAGAALIIMKKLEDAAAELQKETKGSE